MTLHVFFWVAFVILYYIVIMQFLPLLHAPVYFCKLYIFLQLTHQKDYAFQVNKVYFWFLLILTMQV